MSRDPWTFPEGLLKQIPELHYMLVLDNNTSLVHLEVGPKTYLCKDQETAVHGPAKMIVIPPGHYATIQNPVFRTNEGATVLDSSGQVALQWGEEEIRLEQPPFPLYPGEVCEAVRPLEIIEHNTALRIQATRDFHDKYLKDGKGKPVFHTAGTEWWIFGPATYVPQVGSRIVCKQKPNVIQSGHAIRLRARKQLIDATGTKRETGEEWLYTKPGAYFPEIDEVVVGEVVPQIITDKTALHLTAVHQYTDRFGILRECGSEWLVTNEQSESYLLDINERLVKVVNVIALTKREYMVINNPVGADGKPQYGKQEYRRGETTFFLNPGETGGKKKEVIVLTAGEALEVQTIKDHVKRK